MVKERTSQQNPTNIHFVDIHEVVPEEEEEDQEEEEKQAHKMAEKPHEKRLNRPQVIKLREGKRTAAHRGFSRQVSLETGVSKLNEARNEIKALPRSGRSFGGFGSSHGVDTNCKRGEFNMFRTKSTLGKQNSFMLPLRKESGVDQFQKNADEGVGLLDESESEDILLPKDKQWPFLLRFPIGCFGMCLGLSSQAILWNSLAISPATKFLHIPPYINLVLWILALVVLVCVTTTYLLKCIFYFEAIRREYFHPVRINFFFAPWVVCMFLAIGAPPMIAQKPLHPALWCAFMIPYFLLELKIYGQWLSGGKRRLCKVANPSSHLSVVGNFVGAVLAAKVGWNEAGKFLWAIGFAHYLVLFVTLYQRLPTSVALPKELHPVYSMFIAAPSAASIAWEAIYGEFDGSARTCYFIALFLYISLVVRLNFFLGFSVESKGIALTLSFLSSTMVFVLFVCTFLHAFFWQTLFPNDLAIAITNTRHIKEKKPINLKRWAKQSLVSIKKNGAGDKNTLENE
ncbi:C4-dicarboxylate transporter/malic acid transport protein [Cynara cardunculus var. scolymus]|uniref:C4-dicarboxylate transporter/malic acid transport protein n=1 Tax=Cynara cardunculus var. scolymus TaxID=59895 RepID=A0A103XR98_CYNCS|nr:C4-dicarboxylate transporter/malic acid transport protein [Cynara cardunculus var. scolymus]